MANDGSVDSAVAKATVTVSPANNAPVVDLDTGAGGNDSTATFSETPSGSTPVSIAAAAGVSDPDNANLASATITLTNHPDGAAESLSVNTTGTSITASSYNSGTGVLTLTGSDTVAHYQQVLQTLKYDNSAHPPDNADRLVNVTVNDGSVDSNSATATVHVVPLDDPPVVDLNGAGAGFDTTTSFTEGSGSTTLAGAADVTDSDTANLQSADVTLTNRPDGNAESLSADTTGTSITADAYNSTTGVLHLHGADTVAHYQQVLRTVAYNNSSDTPNTTARSITFKANDGQQDSNVATATLSVTPTNDAPTVDLNGSGTGGLDTTPSFTEDGGAVSLGSNADVSDPDNANLASATITLTNHPDGNAESLSVNTTGTSITAGSYNSGTGVLTLSGSDTLAHYQQVIRTLAYNNTSQNPSSANRIVNVTVNDGSVDSATAKATISVTPVNDAPTVDMSGGGGSIDSNAAFTEDSSPQHPGSGPVALGASADAADVDNANLASADVTLTNHPDGSAESLAANTAGTSITVDAYNSTTGVLHLHGADTVAHYQQVIRTVKYDNSSNTPSSTNRDVTTKVNDGSLDSTAAHTTVTVTPTNDAPTAVNQTFNGANSAVGNTTLDVGTTASSPDKHISGSLLTGSSDPDGPSAVSVVAATGQATTAGGSVDINADGSFVFHPKAGFTGDDTFSYTVTDGMDTTTKTVTVHVQSMVWYADSAAVTNGNGTSNSPFNTLAAAAGHGLNGAGGAGDDDSPGDVIFLKGSFTGGLALENNQNVYGQRFGLVVGSDTLAAPTGSNASIAGGLVLASGNTIQAIDLGNAGGAALGGSTVGTATMDTGTNGSGSINNATGKAVDISGGTLSMAFTGVSSGSTTGSSTDAIRLDNTQGTFTGSGGTLQNATDQDVDISGTNTSDDIAFTYDGSIADTTGTVVNVSGQSGGTKDFNGTIGTAGTPAGAISLSSNTGATVRFDGGTILSTGASNAFSATGGGTVDVTDPNALGTAPDNTLATTTGRAVNIASTTIGAAGVTFRSVSASGAPNGIVLSSTGSTGPFLVSGDGSTTAGLFDRDGSGGTIGGATGDAVSLSNASNVTLRQMNINSPALDGVEATGGGSIKLSAMSIDTPGASNPAPGGDGFGTGNGVRLENVTGASAVDNNSRIYNWQASQSNAIVLHNTSTDFTSFTLDHSLVTTSATGAAGFHANINGATSGTVSLTNNEFTLIDQNAAQILNNGSGTITGIVQRNNFHDADATSGDGNNTLYLALAGSGQLNFTIGGPTAADGNTFHNLARLATLAGVLQVDSATVNKNGSTLNGTIQHNTISNDAGFVNGRRGIDVQIEASSSTHDNHNITIADNTVTNVSKQGVSVTQVTVGNSTISNSTITIQNNQLGTLASPVGTEGAVDSGSGLEYEDNFALGTDTASITTDLNIIGNSVFNNNSSAGVGTTVDLTNREIGSSNSSQLDATILGNTINNANAAGSAFRLLNSAGSGASPDTCLDLNAANTTPNSITSGANGFQLTNNAGPYAIEGMAAGSQTTAAVASFLSPRNNNQTVTAGGAAGTFQGEPTNC
jgi:hypothetical protein